MAISPEQFDRVFPAAWEVSGESPQDLDWDALLAEEAAKHTPLACEVELASVLAARLLHHVTHIACSTADAPSMAFLKDITHYLTMVDETLRALAV